MFLAAILANICLRNSQAFSSRSWIRRGVISCSLHTLFYEINDSVVNSERGELVRGYSGSDPPLVYSAQSTAGDMWQAPIRLPLQTPLAAGVEKAETKPLYRLPTGSKQFLKGFDGRLHDKPQDNKAISHAPGHGSR